MAFPTEPANILIAITMLAAVIGTQCLAAKTHHLVWDVVSTNLTRNCVTVNMPTVNGLFPGPVVEITEGDTVVVRVTNKVGYPVTIHWHGIKQFLTNWADGPGYITQCPLKYGMSYVYEFTVINQSGSFHWHAHVDFVRVTVYGAFIVHPKDVPPYGKITQEIPMIFGEFYSVDNNRLVHDFQDKFIPILEWSIASTINGKAGPLYNCSTDEAEIIQVTAGSTYLLRLINTALNEQYYFKIANHNLTVVAADGNYLQPFTTNEVVIGAGQTIDVLLTANQISGSYYFGVSIADLTNFTGVINPSTAGLGILEYLPGSNLSTSPIMVDFPSTSSGIDWYLDQLKNLNNPSLSKTVDHNLYYVSAVAVVDCKPHEKCINKTAATMQNVSFDLPQHTSILEAYFNNASGVYTTDFPDHPVVYQNFTDHALTSYYYGNRGTKVKYFNFNDTVQLVLQNAYGNNEFAHPYHLHGHDFYVIGRNYSSYNTAVDPLHFNLVNPPKFNTYTIPKGGWVALRFQADNPGVWLLHCHFSVHELYGMETVFITGNGNEPTESLSWPLHPLPICT